MENCQCLQEATTQWVTLSPNQLLTRKHTRRYTHRKQSVFSHQDIIFILANGFARCSGLAEFKFTLFVFLFSTKKHTYLLSPLNRCACSSFFMTNSYTLAVTCFTGSICVCLRESDGERERDGEYDCARLQQLSFHDRALTKAFYADPFTKPLHTHIHTHSSKTLYSIFQDCSSLHILIAPLQLGPSGSLTYKQPQSPRKHLNQTNQQSGTHFHAFYSVPALCFSLIFFCIHLQMMNRNKHKSGAEQDANGIFELTFRKKLWGFFYSLI